MPKSKCGARPEGATDDSLVCDLPKGHPGPVHKDGDVAWGDHELP